MPFTGLLCARVIRRCAFFCGLSTLLFLSTSAAAQVKLSSSTSPSQGEPGVSLVYVTGANFPSGTIPVANVGLTLTPAGGGASIAVPATGIQTVVGSTRRVQFQVPASIVPTAPAAYNISLNGTTSSGTAFSSINTASLIVNPPGSVTLSPGSGTAGTMVSVTITGLYNNGFVQGSTAARFGPGTSVGGATPGVLGPVTVTGPNTATAQVAIAVNSQGGPQQVLVETGSEEIYSTFAINQAAPTQLLFTAGPTSIVSGQTLPSVQVAFEDGAGNIVQNTSSVTVALGNNPTGDVLTGTLTQPAVNGVATFPGLSLKKVGTGYTLTANGAGFTATSNPFNVIAGAAAQLLFTSQPASATAGQSLGSVQVSVEDANGNLITSSNSLSMALSANLSSGILSGTLTESTVNGVATFSDLSVNKTGTGYTLSASSSTLTALSNPFNIAAGAAAQLVFTSQPANANIRQSLGSVQVSIEDGNGNLVTTAASVTVAIGTNPSNGVLAGTLTQPATNGVARFPDLTLNKTGKGYTLTASSSVLNAISTPFNVTFSSGQQAACVPSSAQSVLVQGKNVMSYIPNGNWRAGAKNVQVVPIEGAGTRATIVTPNIVNSCASNWVTGQTVCTADGTDVYIISGSTLTNTLTSASSTYVGSPFISGGVCNNCGVAINAVTNQAVIAMGLIQGGAGVQLLDLDTNTLEPPISSNNLGISEDILVDPNLNLVLSPSEVNNYALFDLSGSRNAYSFDISKIMAQGSVADSAAEDCTTGIALSSQEDATPAALFITDLTQATFDTTSTPPKWTAPAQTQLFPEFFNTEGIAVASEAHLGVVIDEFSSGGLGVFQLPSTAGTGTPSVVDYVEAKFPLDPSGNRFDYTSDPHTVTAYISPNNGRAYGVVGGAFTTADRYVAIVDLPGILNATRSAPHTVDSKVDLRVTGLVRFVAVGTAPAQLAFISPPAGGVAGDYLQIQVALEDAQGNIDTNARNKITLSLSDSAMDSQTVDAFNGVAAFSLRATQAGSFTLSASAAGLPTNAITPFVISPAAQAHLIFETQPINIIAGQTLPAIQVSRRDAFGNLAPSNAPITLALNQSGTLVGTTSIVPVTGVANFAGLSVDTGGSFFFRASEDSLPFVESAFFQVATGPAAELAFLIEPTNSTDGAPLNPIGFISVAVEDTFGNIVTSASNPVMISFGANPGNATLAGVTSQQVSGGRINFSVTVNFAGLGYTLVASSPGLTSAISTPFDVKGVGAPAQLVFLSQPGNGIAGQPLAMQVAIGDAQGNIVTTLNGNTVSLRLGNNPVDATLSGYLSEQTVSGVASFPYVLVDKAASGYTLVASAAGLPNASSAPFNITPGGASKLAFLSQPANFTVGTEMNPIRVAVEDSSGNIVTNYANPIFIGLNDNPPNGTLSGTRSVTPVNGVATFSNLSIDKPGNGYNLLASINGGSVFAFSNFFNVLAIPAIGVSPANIKQGASISVTITGQNTHFQQGITKANFGPGLMVGNGLVGGYGLVNVTGATSAVAQVTAAQNATPGSRTPVLQTGNEQDIIFDGFAVLGTPFLNSISPGSGQPGQTISVTIVGVFTSFVTGTTQANFGAGISVGGGPIGGFGPVAVTSPTTAVAQIAIAAGAAVGLRTSIAVQTGAEPAVLQEGGFLVLGTVVGPPPVFNFTSLTEGMEITAPTQVAGIITSPNLSSWTLDYAPVGSKSFISFATGTTSTVNGTLDPTLLLNGMFTVRLTAVDQSGQTSSSTSDVVVTRNLKIGNFTLSFTDLSVPVAGIPIQVIRTYDSRDKTIGDFGIGWTLSVKSVRIDTNGILGNNWMGTTDGGIIPTYCVQPGQNYVVSARLPDGTVYQFRPVPTPDTQCAQVLPPASVDLMFVPIGSTPPGVQLSQPNGSGLIVSGGFPGPLKLVDPFTFEAYGFGGDTDQWMVTLRNGQTLQTSVTAGVQAITDRNGNTLTIDANGITSSHGPGVTFTRDAQNRITGMRDPKLNLIQYSYQNGDLITVVDQRNNTSQFTYDTAHDLISYTDPTGAQPIRNVYDDSGRLIQVIDAFGHITNINHDLSSRTETISDFLGNPSTYVYDSDGNVVSETDALGGLTTSTYDGNDNLLSRTDPLGHTTSFTYDANNNVVTQTDALGHTIKATYNKFNQPLTLTDGNSNIRSNTFDPNGNLVAMVDALGNTRSWTNDADGNTTSATDPLGHTTNYTYDGARHLATLTDANGNVSSYTYDSNGNRTSESVTRTTPSGTQTIVTRYAFDAANNVTAITYPDGSTVQKTYSATGLLSSTTDQLDRTTSYNYDAEGHMTQLAYPDGKSVVASYDANGQRTQVTARSGATTLFSYDSLGRLTDAQNMATGATTRAVFDAVGNMLSFIDSLGHTTQYTYDANNRRTSITDALHNVTAFTYDAAGNQITALNANGTVTHQYDSSNRLIKTIYPDGTFDQQTYDSSGELLAKTDAEGKTTNFSYDARGHLSSLTDALGQVTQFAYDEMGNRISQTDANHHTTTFTYDSRGHRTGRTLPGGQSESFTYDASGNIVVHIDFSGKVTTYNYNDSNQLISKVPDPSFNAPAVTFSYRPSGQRASMTDATGLTTYSYDNSDRLIQVVRPNGTISYAYDLAGNLASVSTPSGTQVSYTYDALNRLASASDLNSGSTTYTYNPVGNTATVTYPNGLTHSYAYDSKARLNSVQVKNASASVAGYSYTIDSAGHRLSVAELGSRTVNYAFDNIYRLSSETASGATTGPNGAVEYTYDPVANRTATSSTLSGIAAGSFAYDPDDRLASDVYDATGNTISSGGVADVYDFENRLVQHGSVTMTYDGDGNRVSKTAGGITTKYLVDDHNPTGLPQVLEESASDGSTHSFVYGLNRISQKQFIPISGTTLTNFYIYDGHASVRGLADGSGTVTDTYDYDAFGNLIHSTGSTPNEFRFAGEEYDADLNLYYLRARYFNPVTGRFWTMDPHGGGGESAQSLNHYLYASADPIDRIDPTGNQDIISEVLTVEISGELASTAVSSGIHSSLGSSVLGWLAEKLLGSGFFDKFTLATPDAALVGFNLGGTVGFPEIPVGLTFGGGLELLLGNHTGNTAVYSYVGASITVGGPGVGAAAYVGEAFNTPDSADYASPVLTVALPPSILPKKVEDKVLSDEEIDALAFANLLSTEAAVSWLKASGGRLDPTSTVNFGKDFKFPGAFSFNVQAGRAAITGPSIDSRLNGFGIGAAYYWQIAPGDICAGEECSESQKVPF